MHRRRKIPHVGHHDLPPLDSAIEGAHVERAADFSVLPPHVDVRKYILEFAARAVLDEPGFLELPVRLHGGLALGVGNGPAQAL